MNVDSRTFIATNLRRSDSTNQGQIAAVLPNDIFSGKLETITLRHLTIDFNVETLGSSNNQFIIRYPETADPIMVTLVTNAVIESDLQLAELLADSINDALGLSNVFQVFHNISISYEQNVYRNNNYYIGSYTIFTQNGITFGLDMSVANSIGSLIGFGNGIYTKRSSYKGGNSPPVGAYESIHIVNKAMFSSNPQYDQPVDHACKMNLYRSDGTLIDNRVDPRDSTISLPIVDGYISSAIEFCKLIEVELNSYKSEFTSDTKFLVNYNFVTRTFTISANVIFGIGFRFARGYQNLYGSLHRHLGFDKKIYIGQQSYTSVRPPQIFENSYIGEYLFVCSDVIESNYDASLIMPESSGGATFIDCLFAIPISIINDGSFSPAFESEYRVRIHASRLAKMFNEELTDEKSISFYLRVSSGRHIGINSQWSLKFSIDYLV